jgi:hypothetical protein
LGLTAMMPSVSSNFKKSSDTLLSKDAIGFHQKFSSGVFEKKTI